jgi:hypothetical protein
VYELEFGRAARELPTPFPWSDLRTVWTEEFGGSDEQSLIAHLEEHWPAFTGAAFKEERLARDKLNLLDARDPLFLDADLLGAINRHRHEPTHTRAIGFLIDPERSGKLGVALLRALLDTVDPQGGWDMCPDDDLRKARIRIEPACELPNGRTASPDLVVRVVAEEGEVLFVIENKVGAFDHEDQLQSYESWANGQKVGRVIRVVQVYLTPEGDPPKRHGGDLDADTGAFTCFETCWREDTAFRHAGRHQKCFASSSHRETATRRLLRNVSSSSLTDAGNGARSSTSSARYHPR